MGCGEGNLEEFILSDKYDMIVRFGVELVRDISGFGGVP